MEKFLTIHRHPRSWNNNVNMLYIDQPVSVGFSFNEAVASTLDLLTGSVTPINGSLEAVQTNATFVKGLLPSQDTDAFPNTTANTAKVLWQFTQIWLQEFSEHESCDDRVSIWTNSVRCLNTFKVIILMLNSMAVITDQQRWPISSPKIARFEMALYLRPYAMPRSCISTRSV